MKRWNKSLALLSFFMVLGVVGLTGGRPDYFFAAHAMASPRFIATWLEVLRGKMAEHLTKQGEKNLESEVIRIELEGRGYDVPLRYSYGESIEKHGRWLTAKADRVQVGALTLSALLPDLKPYYPNDDARWKIKGHGQRIEVTITNSLGEEDWFQRYRSKYFGGQDKHSTLKGENHGLIRFGGHGHTSDTYFPLDTAIELTISCNKQVQSADFFPSCNVRSNYRTGIVLDYYYSKDYLPDWREIDLKLKTLFNQFEQAAQLAVANREK